VGGLACPAASAGCAGPPSVAAGDALFCRDPTLTNLHAHRENGTSDYLWHLFDKLEDLRPLLK
jgi:hypothetical protein